MKVHHATILSAARGEPVTPLVQSYFALLLAPAHEAQGARSNHNHAAEVAV
jgi:hypothetical protein